MSNEWVKLTGFSTLPMAELVRSALEANGIEARVFNAHSSAILPHMSLVITADVMVRKRFLEEAKKIMLEFEKK
jgi:hypothetical protein